MKKTSMFVLLVLTLIVSGCTSRGTETANYPSKPIEVIVPYGPGGSTDQVARILEKSVKRYLPNGQTIVVVNKPGGASVVGVTELFKAKADGYKLAMVSSGPLSIQPHLGNTLYSHDSFRPVIKVATSPLLFSVKADAPWRSFREWHEYVSANPERFVYGGAGTGSIGQVAFEKILLGSGLKAKYVPFEGNAQSITALLGGHIHGASTTTEIKGQAEELRILANLGTTKADFYRDVPTIKELGYNTATEVYFGLIAPKDTPPKVVEVLHTAFKQALDDEEVRANFAKVGLIVSYAGPEEFQKEISSDYAAFGTVLKGLNLAK